MKNYQQYFEDIYRHLCKRFNYTFDHVEIVDGDMVVLYIKSEKTLWDLKKLPNRSWRLETKAFKKGFYFGLESC